MTAPQPGWYADPAGAGDLRWWDGERWTATVLVAGVPRTAPLPLRAPAAGGGGAGRRALLPGAGLVLRPGPGGVHVLRDPSGGAVGTAEQVEISWLEPVARAVPALRGLAPRRVEVRDPGGSSLLLLTRSRARTLVEAPEAVVVGDVLAPGPPQSRWVLRRSGEVAALLDQARGRREVRDPRGARLAVLEGGAASAGLVITPTGPLPDDLAALVVAAGVTLLLDGSASG